MIKLATSVIRRLKGRIAAVLITSVMLVACTDHSPSPLCVDNGDLGTQSSRKIFLEADDNQWVDTGLTVTEGLSFSINSRQETVAGTGNTGGIFLCGLEERCHGVDGQYSAFIISKEKPSASAAGTDLTPCAVNSSSAPDYSSVVCQNGIYSVPSAPSSGRVWMRITDQAGDHGDGDYTHYTAKTVTDIDRIESTTTVFTGLTSEECAAKPGTEEQSICRVANKSLSQCQNWGWDAVGSSAEESICSISNIDSSACSAYGANAHYQTSMCIITNVAAANCTATPPATAVAAAGGCTIFGSTQASCTATTPSTAKFNPAICLVYGLPQSSCPSGAVFTAGTTGNSYSCTKQDIPQSECSTKGGTYEAAGCKVTTPKALTPAQCASLGGTSNADSTCTIKEAVITPPTGSNYGAYNVVLRTSKDSGNAVISTLISAVIAPVRNLLLGIPEKYAMPLSTSQSSENACTNLSGTIDSYSCAGLTPEQCSSAGGSFSVTGGVCTNTVGSTSQCVTPPFSGRIKTLTCEGLDNAADCTATGVEGTFSEITSVCTGGSSCPAPGIVDDVTCSIPASSGYTRSSCEALPDGVFTGSASACNTTVTSVEECNAASGTITNMICSDVHPADCNTTAGEVYTATSWDCSLTKDSAQGCLDASGSITNYACNEYTASECSAAGGTFTADAAASQAPSDAFNTAQEAYNAAIAIYNAANTAASASGATAADVLSAITSTYNSLVSNPNSSQTTIDTATAIMNKMPTTLDSGWIQCYGTSYSDLWIVIPMTSECLMWGYNSIIIYTGVYAVYESGENHDFCILSPPPCGSYVPDQKRFVATTTGLLNFTNNLVEPYRTALAAAQANMDSVTGTCSGISSCGSKPVASVQCYIEPGVLSAPECSADGGVSNVRSGICANTSSCPSYSTILAATCSTPSGSGQCGSCLTTQTSVESCTALNGNVQSYTCNGLTASQCDGSYTPRQTTCSNAKSCPMPGTVRNGTVVCERDLGSGLSISDCTGSGGVPSGIIGNCDGASGCGAGAVTSVVCSRAETVLNSECTSHKGTVESRVCANMNAAQCASVGGVLQGDTCIGANNCTGGIVSALECTLPPVGLTEKIYKNIIQDTNFRSALRALLVLAIVLFAFSYMAGLTQVTHKELIIFILKLSIVLTVIGDNSWEFFYKHLFALFVEGMDDLIWMMSNGINGLISNSEQPMMASIGESGIDQIKAVFNFLGTSLSIIFSSETNIKISSLLGAFPLGIFLVAVIYISIAFFLFAVARAILMYLTSIIMIALLLLLAPIFICFILFAKTRQMFIRWIKQIAVFAIQPVLLFIILAVFNVLIILSLYNLLDFTACYTCVWKINLPISEILNDGINAGAGVFGGSAGEVFPNFDEFCAIPGYLPWGLDPKANVISQVNQMPIMFLYTIIFAVLANLMLKFVDWVDAIATQIVGEEGGVNMNTSRNSVAAATSQAKGVLAGNQAGLDPRTWKGGIAGMANDTLQWADRATGNLGSNTMKRVARTLAPGLTSGGKGEEIGGEQSAYSRTFMTGNEKAGWDKKKDKFDNLSKEEKQKVISANKDRQDLMYTDEKLNSTDKFMSSPGQARHELRKMDKEAQMKELRQMGGAQEDWFRNTRNAARRLFGMEEVTDQEPFDKTPEEKLNEYYKEENKPWAQRRLETEQKAKDEKEAKDKKERENKANKKFDDENSY